MVSETSARVEETLLFYQRMSGLARAGQLRNPPPEYFAMRLGSEDIEPLVAFLRALNETREHAREKEIGRENGFDRRPSQP